MPIYEFQCKKCNAQIEVFQRLSDKQPTKCSKCGGRLERLTSAPAIQFKGSGWYVTDYAAKATKGEKAESDTSTDDKKPEKKKDSSPDKKTPEKTSAPKSSGDD